MKKVGDNYIKASELESVEFFPPNDHCGYYGLVLKPKLMPTWLAYLLRNRLKIYLGWLNMSYKQKPYDNPTNKRRWWVYPTGSHAAGELSIGVKPFLWCEIEYIGPVKNVKGELIEWKEKGIYREK